MVISAHASLVSLTIVGILERGPKSFGGLLEASHSLFPDELQSALDRLHATGEIELHSNHYQLSDRTPNRWLPIQIDWQENLDRAHDVLSRIMSDIHLPHCLDYEWWFAHTSREAIAKHVLARNILPVPQAVAFLGSPIFGAFCSFLMPDTQVFILDRSAATLKTIESNIRSDRLTLVHYDAEQPLPAELIGVAEMAFFDPPWYLDYYDLFFRRCVQLTARRRAVVATVLFPVLTRPLALSERQQVMKGAMALGLSLIDFQSQLAQYLTPLFESEALAEKGIQAKNWRRGDLAIFLTDGETEPQNGLAAIEPFQWNEAIINKVKVKIKIKHESRAAYITPRVTPLSGGANRLASVSRRDPIRNEVDLWTATHQGFSVQGSHAVWAILQGVRDGTALDDIVERVRDAHDAMAVFPASLYNDVHDVWAQLRNLLCKSS